MADADVVVIGSGPNGLVAAAVLARAGRSVTVVERAPKAGGSVRSDELTLPGYVHDTHSAFYGMLHASPVFKELGLDRRMAWCRHDDPVAAAVGPGDVAVIHRDAADTAKGLAHGHAGDGEAWEALWSWWQREGRKFFAVMLAPVPSARPMLRFLRAARVRGALEAVKLQLEPIEAVATSRFEGRAARALLASGTTHTDLAADATGSTPAALMLDLVAQEFGMPIPRGGAGRLAEALAEVVCEAGGTIVTDAAIRRVVIEGGRAIGVETDSGDVVRARHAVVADVGVLALCRRLVGEEHFPSTYLDGLRRFRHGTGIFKVDLALDGPVPWADGALGGVAVVHLTGDLDTMARSAFEARRGLLPARPLLVVGQQSVADPTRAPPGSHTLWVETHVPPVVRGDGADVIDARGWGDARDAFTARAIDLLETHAPGLSSRIVATSVRTPPDLEAENPNLVGGDLAGGSMALDQQLVFRPVPGWFRYRTPVRGLYLCSASAHPGGAVHGMTGRNCAQRVLRDSRIPRRR